VLAGACPNLLREASLYRYSEDPTDCRSETPVDAHNHALAALRYMVCMIDAHQMARLKGKSGTVETAAEEAGKGKKEEQKWLRLRNEALWTRIF
jgi:hypothetical protein